MKKVRLLALLWLLLPLLKIGDSFSFGLNSSILLSVCPTGPSLPLIAADEELAVVALPPRPWLVPATVSFLGNRYGLKPTNF